MDNINYGYLVVAVSTANGSVPLKGATVRILQNDNKTLTVLKTYKTDISGRTPMLNLPAPPKNKSQSPGGENVFSSYVVQTDCKGYVSVQNNQVEIFDGVKSIQNVWLVPSGADNGEEIFTDSNERGL